MQLRALLLSAIAALATASLANAQTTWWVDANAPSGGNGSQGSPFQTIQRGIVAAHQGDWVQVLPGTYFENVNFLLKSITVASSAGPGATVIQGDGSASVVRINANQAVLDGFTVQGGGGSYVGNDYYGGGILMYDTHGAVVVHCIVRGNHAMRGDGIGAFMASGAVISTTIEDNGGPFYSGWCWSGDDGGGVYGPAELWLDHCTIRNNKASTHGGGVYGASLTGCDVSANYAAEGAGLSHCYANSTTIAGNTAYSCDGSYAACGGAEFSTLEGCTIADNKAWDNAGGVQNSVLRQCVLVGNAVTSPINGSAYGGGAWNSVLEDCLVENNWIEQGPWAQPGYGGGASDGSALRTVFRGNSASTGSGVDRTLLDRCIVVGNGNVGVRLGQPVSNSIIRDNGGIEIIDGGTVSYCDVEGGFAGPGNIDLDPLFWNAAAGDFHLQPTSPCIDAGDPAVSDPDGTRVDMGAFPHDPLLCLSPVVYCPAGHSSDGCVPSIHTLGNMSLSQMSAFEIGATNLPGQRFVSTIYGVSGAIQAPWGGGASFSCVAPPRQRTGLLFSDGTGGACDGTVALDFSAWLAAHPFALGTPFSAGDVVWAQVWYRDPGAPAGTNFTGAVRFMTCP